MSNIRVVDLNEEVAQEAETPIQNEEVKEEVTEVVNEEVTETPIQNETTNKNILDIDKEIPQNKEEVTEQAKGFLNSNSVGVEQVQKKPRERTQDKIVSCPKCQKSMKLKSYRYGHEQNCKGRLEDREVKPHSKPRASPKPKPVAEEITDDVINEVSNTVKQKVITNVVNSIQSNPINSLAQHYQLLQQEYIKQKQEKYNTLCQNMFSSKSKKR